MSTHEQLNILQSNEKVVFISGQFGSGKTLVLKVATFFLILFEHHPLVRNKEALLMPK